MPINLPNRLTIMRIFLVIIMIFVAVFPYDKWNIVVSPVGELGSTTLYWDRLIILILFTIGVITDYLDGYIARKWHLISSFGKLMDPIADKLLVNSLFILLTAKGEIPVLVTIIMVARDIFVDGLRLILVEQGKVVSASPLGKMKTVTQMIALILILLFNYPFSIIEFPFADIMVYVATFISVASGIDYFYRNRKSVFGVK